jgi:hypothetical protein
METGKIKRKEFLILFLCTIIGFALRFYTFDQKSLWLDEIYTLQDSRDGFKGQLEFFKENPTYLRAPLFFVLTLQFYPFTKPGRDLRIIPMVFGTLSILLYYFLSKSFSSGMAYGGKDFTIPHSRTYWTRYVAEGNRVWIVLD